MRISVYYTKVFINSLGRAFREIKNDVYFIVIAFLVTELFKILIYANEMTCDATMWTQNDLKSQNMEYLVTTWCRQSHSGSGAYNGSNAYFNIIKQPFSYLGVHTHP